LGSDGDYSSIEEVIYTGNVNNYQRLYVAGTNTATQNMVASLDTSLSGTSALTKVYTQNTPDYRISHIHVTFLTLAMCGTDSAYSNQAHQDEVWAAYMTVSATTDDISYQRDFKFNYLNLKYCGGVFIDNNNLYVLVISDY
jgi:hypothetical protein